jgi:hypothetical protein
MRQRIGFRFRHRIVTLFEEQSNYTPRKEQLPLDAFLAQLFRVRRPEPGEAGKTGRARRHKLLIAGIAIGFQLKCLPCISTPGS